MPLKIRGNRCSPCPEEADAVEPEEANAIEGLVLIYSSKGLVEIVDQVLGILYSHR